MIDETNLMIGNNAMGYTSAVLGTYNAGYQLNVMEGKSMLPQTAARAIGTFSLVDRTTLIGLFISDALFGLPILSLKFQLIYII